MKRSAGAGWPTAVILLASAGLSLFPVEAVRPLRVFVRDVLRPGQLTARRIANSSRRWAESLPIWSSDAARDRILERELQALRLESRQLQLESARLREDIAKLSGQDPFFPTRSELPPLVMPRLVEARVLGEETAALWRERGRKLLSVGTTNLISESALVLDDTRPLVDLGADARLSPGDAVYAGRVAVGKIAEAGRFSSTLRLVTDPAYSGCARLARRTSRGLVFGSEGTLVGDGSELCRLRHITDPVNVDDEVYTGSADGLVRWPMYYGKVVRAELDAGSREWSVWVKPAATSERLESVFILRRAINPDRILAD